MAQTENTSAPKGHRKRRLFWVFLGVVAFAALGYAVFVSNSWQGLVEQGQSIIAPVAQNTPRIEALEQRIDMLERRVGEQAAAMPSSSALNALNEQVAALKAQVENKDAQQIEAARKFFASALAFWDLRDTIRQGHIFSAQLDSFRAASANDPEALNLATRLDPYASEGVATLPALREELIAAEKAAPPQPTNASSFWEWVRSIFQPLISVRPVKDERFASVEKNLDLGNAAGALEAFNTLPDDVRKNLGAWQARLETRVAAETILQALTAHFTGPALQMQRSAS